MGKVNLGVKWRRVMQTQRKNLRRGDRKSNEIEGLFSKKFKRHPHNMGPQTFLKPYRGAVVCSRGEQEGSTRYLSTGGLGKLCPGP